MGIQVRRKIKRTTFTYQTTPKSLVLVLTLRQYISIFTLYQITKKKVSLWLFFLFKYKLIYKTDYMKKFEPKTPKKNECDLF
jgi:hypothetical protein